MSNHPNRNWRKHTPPSLVRSWLDMELTVPGRTRAEVLRALNATLSTSYTHWRLTQWLNGEHEPLQAVRRYMMRCVIQRVLRQEGVEGLDDAQLDRIADNLS